MLRSIWYVQDYEKQKEKACWALSCPYIKISVLDFPRFQNNTVNWRQTPPTYVPFSVQSRVIFSILRYEDFLLIF